MKTIKYILSLTLLSSVCLGISSCSEKQELISINDRGIEITDFSLGMAGRASLAGATTKAPETLTGFSVNTSTDPTFKGLSKRFAANWKMDFTLYFKDGADNNKEKKYDEGSFTGESNSTESNGTITLTPSNQRYYPNYLKPKAEAFLYPDGWNIVSSTINTTQTADANLLAQDVLTRVKADIDVSHHPEITFIHKHSMLNFVINDVIKADIENVTVKVGTDNYEPFNVATTANTDGSSNIEYMVVLPETTKGKANNPVVVIETSSGTTSSIIYEQTINILKSDDATLGSNKCYCFTLQGVKLQISPVTVLNWATGASIPGEYIAVTAYPTFKVNDLKYAEKTFYFYYDNKLVEKDSDDSTKSKLQKITFNKNAECTIKPDGRILKYIYTDSEVESIKGSKGGNMTPKSGAAGKEVTITLGTMIIDLSSEIPTLP